MSNKNDSQAKKFSMYHKSYGTTMTGSGFMTEGYTFDHVGENGVMVFLSISNPNIKHRCTPAEFIFGLRNTCIVMHHWYGLYLDQEMTHDEIIEYVESLRPLATVKI